MRAALQAFAAVTLLAASHGIRAADGDARLTAVDANGLRVALDAVQAGSDTVVLVNFWATWCKPCLEEIPLFMELQKTYGPQGFKLVAVSLDEIETLESTVKPFMQKWFPEFRSYISTEYDMDDIVSVVDNGWNEVLPTSYLFARDGTLAERLQGKYSAAEFSSKVDALLTP